jgi:hypothetical protein
MRASLARAAVSLARTSYRDFSVVGAAEARYVGQTMKSRIMYVELKMDGLRGAGRIGRVAASKTGTTLYYAGRTLAPLKGQALKANYFDTKTLEEFWISGPRLDGCDSLHPATIEIDDDSREEYWREYRKTPNAVLSTSYRSPGKSKRERGQQETAVRRRDMDRRWRAPRPDVNGVSTGTADGDEQVGAADRT